MRQTRSIYKLQITVFVALIFACSGVLAGKDKIVEQSTKTNPSVGLTQEKVETVLIKPGEPAPSNSPSSSTRTGEQITWQVISGGATNGSSTNYSIMGTVGQTAVGPGSSTNYQLLQGFWQNFGSGCCNMAGDFNDDEAVDIADLTAMVAFMFGGGPPAGCEAEGDINGDGATDIADLTYRVAFMFGGGPAPICGPE